MQEKILTNEINKLANSGIYNPNVSQRFLERLKEGNLTRDENEKTHFCVYFAAFDPSSKQVFIGHHKKSGHWLFNGGHIDKGEDIKTTLLREIDEEWGVEIRIVSAKEPDLLTITPINNPGKQTCTEHLDIWYFIEVNKNNFKPKKEKILKEFYEVKWLTAVEAKKITKDKSTVVGIEYIENKFLT